MKNLFRICCLPGLLLALASCQKDGNVTNQQAAPQNQAELASGKQNGNTRTFTVTVENVSTPGLLNTPRLGGIVPLSPGAWAIYNGNDPMFTEGQMADIGTERIAEDGAAGTKDAAMGALSRVRDHGIFRTVAGPILPGQSAQFSFNAGPGTRLQFETMFVQSNDWFYSFSGKKGLRLFNGNTPVTGDVTSA
ncbi:MAG: spondin domain-containing protein, partial [Flavisolibacter sp.]|nr:spondin domain-containing protein [Flavisolibacter sp.]